MRQRGSLTVWFTPVPLLVDGSGLKLCDSGEWLLEKHGHNWRALAETDISRFKRVIGDGLRARTDRHRETKVAVAAGALNRMLELGSLEHVRFP